MHIFIYETEGFKLVCIFVFFRCGTVTSIRMLPEKYCAFVNFKTKEAAGKAMQNLQVGAFVNSIITESDLLLCFWPGSLSSSYIHFNF